MKLVRLHDAAVDINLLNLSRVADETGFSLGYVSQLLNPDNKRKNSQALKKIQQAVVTLYGTGIFSKEIIDAAA